jgi:hypothetical protein
MLRRGRSVYMNYGEEIAYWYLRLNGFFPITNFVIHRSKRIAHTSDCDVLAVRMPDVYEEIGGKPEDWDHELAQELGFDRVVGVICEVKTGRYALKDIFRPEYVHYAVGRLGFVSSDQITIVADELSNNIMMETGDGRRICKLLIANDLKEPQTFVFRSLNHAEDFINDRVRRYRQKKYADRMYFGSELFQHTIHRIHREMQQRPQGGGG